MKTFIHGLACRQIWGFCPKQVYIIKLYQCTFFEEMFPFICLSHFLKVAESGSHLDQRPKKSVARIFTKPLID